MNKKNKKIVKKSVLLTAFREATQDWDIEDYIIYRDLCNLMIKLLNGEMNGDYNRFFESVKGVVEFTMH